MCNISKIDSKGGSPGGPDSPGGPGGPCRKEMGRIVYLCGAPEKPIWI